jgi:hypothetical protein
MILRVRQTKDWPTLVADWSRRCEGEGAWMSPMRDFVEQLAASSYAYGLHGYVGMQTLVIAQTEEVRDGQDRFIVQYDPRRDIIRMVFTDSPSWIFDEPPRMRGQASWNRECKPDEAFLYFQNFLRQVGWFPKTL